MITTDLHKAKNALINNEIVGMPTETVYGLAGNAFKENVIKKIFSLKGRPLYNPLIVHIKSADFINQVARDIPETALKLADKFWPGPLTLVLKKQPHIPNMVTAGKDTVAVRMPNHALALALLAELEFPLAAPSANPFGSISPTCAEHVSSYFKNELEIILDGGACENGIESTIIGFENNQPILYRHGSIAVEEIEKIVGGLIIATHNDSKPNAPGMLSRHYAPLTATYLANNVSELIEAFKGKKIGLLLFKNAIADNSIVNQEILSSSGNENEAAQKLYAALHRLDKSGVDVIIAEKFPDKGLGKTINDRLLRAAKRK